MAATARSGALRGLLAPYAMQKEFVIEPDSRKDAIDLIAAHYDQLTEPERREFETKMLHLCLDDFKHPVEAKRSYETIRHNWSELARRARARGAILEDGRERSRPDGSATGGEAGLR